MSEVQLTNPLYKNIGIHVIASIFTIDKGVVKVLLVKRTNEPFKGMWSLVGGALYNNEKLEYAVKREIFEKSGLTDVNVYFSGVFDEIDRSPVRRMIALTYVGLIDANKVQVLKKTLKTDNSEWVAIDKVKTLAGDHNNILLKGIDTLKELIVTTDILKSLFPKGVTIPEIQKTYEGILNKTFDRRNFRKKLLSLGIIEDTNKYIIFEGKKPAKLYKFNKKKSKNVL